MQNPTPSGTRILRLKECLALVGVSRATWFDWNNPASPRHQKDLPQRVRLGARSVGWFEHQLISWLQSKQDKAPPTLTNGVSSDLPSQHDAGSDVLIIERRKKQILRIEK
jgi:prophage regulatory protein